MAQGKTVAQAEKSVQLGCGFVYEACYLPPSRMMVTLGLEDALRSYIACRTPCKRDIMAAAPMDIWYMDQFADKVRWGHF